MRSSGLRVTILAFALNVTTVTANEPPTPAGATPVGPALPIPQHIQLDSQKVTLGSRLFMDKRLSRDGRFACMSCHYFDKGGTDQQRLSPSIDGGTRALNTPSIFNVGLLPIYTWAGKRVGLPDLAEAILKSDKGLGSDWPTILSVLRADPAYVRAFIISYPDGIQPKNVTDALAQFMRSLITPNSRFDRYLTGETGAMSAREQKGYRLFKAYGCASCHQGVNLGGNMVSPFGIFGDYARDRGNPTKADLGRFNVTGLEDDKYVFRVPSLRNVALTAPYLHDGSVQSLEDAVGIMGEYMLGRSLPEQDIHLIADFLRSLNGELNGKPL